MFCCHPQNIIDKASKMTRGLSLTENAIKQISDANVLQGKNERKREFEQNLIKLLNKYEVSML